MTSNQATSSDRIVTTRAGGVTTILLNRPEVLNAIHPAMHHEMQAALDAFAADPGQHVCVIRGAGGRAFSAGSDLKYAAQRVAAGDLGEYQFPRCGYGGITERFDLDKPVIAAVDGIAIGGGFEMVLACDLVIASSKARFGLTEPLVGQVALAGGMHRLARQIGLKSALGMILTGRIVDAAEAMSLGIVNEVVELDQMDAAIARWTAAIIAASPAAVRASKQSVYRGLSEPSLAHAIRNQQSYPAFQNWLASPDAVEGPTAFSEKRPARWK